MQHHIQRCWDWLKSEATTTNWRLVAIFYVCCAAVLLYLYNNLEMWLVSFQLGLTTSVICILIFVSLISRLNFFYALSFAMFLATLPLLGVIFQMYGINAAQQTHLAYLVSKAAFSSLIFGLLVKIVLVIREA